MNARYFSINHAIIGIQTDGGLDSRGLTKEKLVGQARFPMVLLILLPDDMRIRTHSTLRAVDEEIRYSLYDRWFHLQSA